MNIIEKVNKEQQERLNEARPIPEFAPGDTIRINVKVVEGQRERVQAFEGVCIARKGGGINSSFTVRKLSYGEGVERVFPLYSPSIDRIEIIRRGDVRRAKLYYLRGRTGKSARIAEKTDGYSAKLSAKDKKATADAKAANIKTKGNKGSDASSSTSNGKKASPKNGEVEIKENNVGSKATPK